ADREQIDPQFTREPGEPSPCDAGRYSSEELGRHHERENATVLERRQCRQEYRQPEVRHAREGKSEVTRQHARCRDVIRRHELKPDKGGLPNATSCLFSRHISWRRALPAMTSRSKPEAGARRRHFSASASISSIAVTAETWSRRRCPDR